MNIKGLINRPPNKDKVYVKGNVYLCLTMCSVRCSAGANFPKCTLACLVPVTSLLQARTRSRELFCAVR